MNSGHLEVVTGTMFSGKTDELLRRLRRVRIGGQPFIIFKPTVDTRSGKNRIKSYDGSELEAHDVSVTRPKDILTILAREERKLGIPFKVIAIDEVQFFPRESAIRQVITALVSDKSRRVIAAGLDRDFRGEPFGAMPDLLAIADEITKLTAVCKLCGSHQACFPQRLINGKPASYRSPQILVGSDESYEARCRNCFVLPGKPKV
ncbi:MAG: tdk [Parcubacteria group bacterium]|nr:tdk [Parcubacteria group bacterium]